MTSMTIAEAFNNISYDQLRRWLHYRENQLKQMNPKGTKLKRKKNKIESGKLITYFLYILLLVPTLFIIFCSIM